MHRYEIIYTEEVNKVRKERKTLIGARSENDARRKFRKEFGQAPDIRAVYRVWS